MWVHNRVIARSLHNAISPFKAWRGRKPDFPMLWEWVCMATRLLAPPATQGKLNTKGKLVVHLAVDDDTKAWRVLDPMTG